uniref:Oleosin n=1 Tax=Aegilops tauschii subsp. strangulata TaxID=200361 RepID=A0A453KLW1_AEGTS
MHSQHVGREDAGSLQVGTYVARLEASLSMQITPLATCPRYAATCPRLAPPSSSTLSPPSHLIYHDPSRRETHRAFGYRISQVSLRFQSSEASSAHLGTGMAGEQAFHRGGVHGGGSAIGPDYMRAIRGDDDYYGGHGQGHNQPAAVTLAKGVAAAAAAGSMLLLSALTLTGTVLALIVATPLLVLFSPVLVPAAIAVTMLTAGFVSSGAFGAAAVWGCWRGCTSTSRTGRPRRRGPTRWTTRARSWTPRRTR